MNNSCQFYLQIKSDFHILKINRKIFCSLFIRDDPHLVLLKGLHWLQWLLQGYFILLAIFTCIYLAIQLLAENVLNEITDLKHFSSIQWVYAVGWATGRPPRNKSCTTIPKTSLSGTLPNPDNIWKIGWLNKNCRLHVDRSAAFVMTISVETFTL